MNVHVANKALGLLLFPLVGCAAPNAITGTYSTLAYNQESGDLNGLEVAIAFVDSGQVVSVQIADGGLNELHLAKIKEVEGVKRFTIHLDDQGAIDFSIKCDSDKCVGEYIWGESKVNLLLPKSNGYWNNR